MKPTITSLSQITPLYLQQYERYLPNAFDDSLTLLEKVNKVIQQLNKIGEVSNDVVTQWNTVMEWVMNEGLNDSVVQKLESMITDGTLDTIINENIFNDLDSRVTVMETSVTNVSDYTLYPQSPKPEKQGVKTKTPKIIHKTTDNELHVIQKTNKGYVHYTLVKNNGANQADRDYGGSHELLRLIRAEHAQNAYVYYDLTTPSSGSLTTNTPSGELNTQESLLFNLPFLNHTKNLSSKGTTGLVAYSLSALSSVAFNIRACEAKKANLLLYCSSGGSDSVDILVNGVVVKNINPRSYVVSGGQAMALIEFDVPCKANTSDTYNVTIRNNHATANAYPCCLNFYELKDYKGQIINNYKMWGSSKPAWIDDNGSSDYAIYDNDAKLWCGSYHGGETSLYERLRWNTNYNYQRNDYDIVIASFSDIVTGSWRVQDEFSIYQHTSIANGKANMTSEFNFNTDGSLEMDFGYSNGIINASTFYTALTCVNSNFDYIFHPKYVSLGVPDDTYYPLPLTEGKVSQVDVNNGLQIDIRFTKFNNKHDKRGAVVVNSSGYRKLYYGVIYGTENVQLSNLTFAKGLDFIVR